MIIDNNELQPLFDDLDTSLDELTDSIKFHYPNDLTMLNEVSRLLQLVREFQEKYEYFM